MNIYIGLILILFLSCQSQQDKIVASINFDNSQIKLPEPSATDTVLLEEVFIDSLTIGRKKFNKVEVYKYRTNDSCYVDIKFYTK